MGKIRRKAYLWLISLFLFSFLYLFFNSTVFLPFFPKNIQAYNNQNWYNQDWQYRKKITIDHTKIPNTDQTYFPVLVKTTSFEFKDTNNNGHVGKSNGGDILFTSSDGTTKLNHEIEKYSNVNGELIAWVQIPNLSHLTDTNLYIYYDNPNASDQWNITGTWNDGGNNYYKAVWHLNESGRGITGEYKDSTGINNARAGGGNVGYLPVQSSGIITNAQKFDGINDYIDAGNNSSLDITGSAITIEAWARNDTTPSSYNGIVSKSGYDNGYRILIGANKKINFQLTGKSYTLYGNSTVTTIGAWNYVVGTYDGINMKLYVNGTKDITQKSRTGNINKNTDHVWIGQGDNGCIGKSWCYPFKDYVDEVRISNVARSTDWIVTTYKNQSSPDTFYALGFEESYSNLPTLIPTLTPTSMPTPTETPTLTPTPTLIPTSIPTPTPTVSDNKWSYKISVDFTAHQDYGMSYPGTYVFNIPFGSANLSVYKKYLLSDNWTKLSQMNSNDYFNGIDAVRFDYTNNKAYVSVSFSDSSDNIFIRTEDINGLITPLVFDRIANYYDNRKAAVVSTGDDWASWSNDAFKTAADQFISRQMWFSPGVITGEMDQQTWSDLQSKVNLGYVEPVSHSRTHTNIPYADYDSEIGGSSNDLKANLNLPSANRKGTTQYVYAYIEPYSETNNTIHQKLGQYKYLVERTYDGSSSWPIWLSSFSIYYPAFRSILMGSDSVTDLTTLNNKFNSVYNANGIYHLGCHPKAVDWSVGGYAQNHLDYIKGKKDVWYTGFGHLFAYHYLQERGFVTLSTP